MLRLLHRNPNSIPVSSKFNVHPKALVVDTCPPRCGPWRWSLHPVKPRSGKERSPTTAANQNGKNHSHWLITACLWDGAPNKPRHVHGFRIRGWSSSAEEFTRRSMLCYVGNLSGSFCTDHLEKNSWPGDLNNHGALGQRGR